MQLRLCDIAPVRIENEALVLQLVAMLDRVAAADDVKAVFTRHPRHQFDKWLREVVRQFPDSVDGRQRLDHGEQLHRKELGEEHEVRAVVGRRLDEILHLVGEVLESGDPAHLILHTGDADFGGRLGGLVIRVEPFDQAGEIVTHRIDDVVAQDAPHGEAFA